MASYLFMSFVMGIALGFYLGRKVAIYSVMKFLEYAQENGYEKTKELLESEKEDK